VLQRSALLTTVVVFIITGLAPGAAPATAAAKKKPGAEARLRADLPRIAKRAGGSGGYVVLDGATGRTIAASSPDKARPLGSAAKLLTTGAAIDLLGPNAMLTTTVETAAPVLPDGTLAGDLVLRGGGDPLLDEPRLQVLADAVQARGIKVVAGSIVGDESRFDTLRGGPATGGAFDPELTGSLGALTYERGRQAPGGPLQPDPGRAAAYRFDDVLEARGLKIRGVPHAGVAPPGAVVLGSGATRLADLVKVIDKTSDDFDAEVLAKLLGGGTTAGGAAKIAAHARKLGAKVTVVDGSGVDARTKGSPRQLARYVRRIRTRAAIAAALPIAGRDGTLADRMTSGPARGTCRAKTGSLPETRVSALAGWCRTHGKTRVFAILRTNVDQEAAKATEDAIVERIAATKAR
jgi:serine-type D-Ala-D-Ala carboxypeptidase/endopeptidase (penicillin-binding protein 4)